MVRFVTDYLELSAKRFPEKIAFKDEYKTMTFGELHDKARRIASGLQKKGFFRQPVALFLGKCVEYVAASQGALYSGNFYSPMDMTMPAKRIEKILQVLKPVVLLTDEKHFEQAKHFADGVPVLLYEDMIQGAIDDECLQQAMSHRRDTDIVSVLFTSGSTGIPKGVASSHRFRVDFIEWEVDCFGLDETEIRGNQAPLYFAIGEIDLYSVLRTGGTMCLMSPKQLLFPQKLMGYLVKEKINTILWVPSLFRAVADFGGLEAEELPPLRDVFFCGEQMPTRQMNQWRQSFPKVSFTNLYGATELLIAAYYTIDRDFADAEPMPIGLSRTNVDILLLNRDNELVGPGEIGEICVLGTGMASGYYGDKERTNVSFGQNPLQVNVPERMFRTGDLARYNKRGELVYVSRKDAQIKHMGYRIELGEVELGIASIDGVTGSCCVYDKARSEIVLFYTGDIKPRDLLKAAADLLPRYMWPSRMEQRDKLPSTLSGKVDRMKLRAEIM